jgi:hypothetical protein
MHPQVTFRGLFPSETTVQEVWLRAGALHASRPDISACHVCIERVSERKQSDRFRVVVMLSSSLAADTLRDSSAVLCEDISVGLHAAFIEARELVAEPPPLVVAGGA